MRKTFSMIALLVLGTALTACGGGDSFGTPTTPGPTGPVVATVSVVASTPTLPSNGSSAVQISAFVRDASNNFIPNIAVAFTADSGGLQVVQGTTDDNGLATATLSTAGDPSNRPIVVTATAGGITSSVTVSVSGSQLSIQGPNALSINQTASYSVSLIDSGNQGIQNTQITLTSAQGNTLSAPTVTTNASGQATFDLTVVNSGDDTITATGLGLTATLDVAVSSDSFTFTTPAANAEILLGANQTVTVHWTQNNAPVAGQTINFATTRGSLSAASAVTNGSGDATVTVSSASAGGAVITASAAGSATAQQIVEFVATTPASIDVQPTVFTMAPMEQSTLTAVVRDAAGNLVKNQTVLFSLQDVTGGTLSTASAVTDSQGRAQSVYTAGSTASASDGVVVTATVQGTVVQDIVNLTVAQRQLFLSLGTGNEIVEENPAQYRLDYIVQVTDANGNGVSGVPLALSVHSIIYYKGHRVGGSPITTQINASCPDEDVNNNGVLDNGEDANTSGRIEAGNIVTVTPRNATTDADGFATVQVFYPQEYAYYLTVDLDARASVQGTEFVRTSRFLLPGSVSDFAGPGAAPGPVSPFGDAANCANPN